MTVTTKQIETIKFQIEFMVMMQNCGRLEEAQESMLKISTLLEQLIGVEVVHWLRRDLFEELEAIRKEAIMKQESSDRAFEEQIEASVKEGITLGLFKDLDGDPTFEKVRAKVQKIEDAVNEDEAMLASLLFAGGA